MHSVLHVLHLIITFVLIVMYTGMHIPFRFSTLDFLPLDGPYFVVSGLFEISNVEGDV